ncbi:hypothetical protein KKF32_00915 [Patescibacteria group bacterium]|nr:hypothetical protein [Patescibacteria group bacterium]
MLETSKDLLNLVIAFCILWFTVFLCWVIYYFAMILRKINEVMEKVTLTLDAVTDFFKKAKEKMDKTASSVSVLLELGKKIFNIVKEKQEEKKTSKRKVVK